MSQENVEIVRNAFDAFTRDDTQSVLRLCDENIVITQPSELPGVSPEQHGHTGVLEAFGIWPEQWDDYRIEILRIADVGDFVVVTTRTGGRGKQSGVEVEMDFSFVFTLRDGTIVEMQIFMREDQALEAAGLREQAMSQENVEIARRCYEAFNRGDFDAAFEDFAPDFELDMSRAIGIDRGMYNLAQFRRLAESFADTLEIVRLEADYIDAGEHVVMPWTNRLRGRDGIEVQARGTWLCTIRDGLIVRICLYQEVQDALEAAGLRE